MSQQPTGQVPWQGQPPAQEWTGQPPAPPLPQQPRRRSWFARHKVLTGLLVLVGVVVAVNLGGGDPDDPAPVTPPTTAQEGNPPPQDAAQEGGGDGAAQDAGAGDAGKAQADGAPGLGTPVRDGKFEFVVTEVETGLTSIGEGITREEPQGQFVLVHLSVTNIGDEAQSFFDGNQKLVDDRGRTHETSSAAMWLEDNDLWVNDINPGNTVEGVLLFDIPEDATPAQLELHDSAFSGGVTVDLR
ncbi:MAG TPA: DUF4352 domain-containing protein [Ornithinicoccus sp.]|jgi:hypothetical protein|nr:DUF4352 domain-containing protein [Ornithinicoccus sp.]